MALGDVVLGAAPLGGFMALKITSVTTPTGCGHRTIVIDDEGVSRTMPRMTLAELDQIIDSYGSPAEAKKTLLLLWLAYRLRMGRTVANIDIA